MSKRDASLKRPIVILQDENERGVSMNQSLRGMSSYAWWVVVVLHLPLLAGCRPAELDEADSAATPTTSASFDYAWVQVGPKGAASVRSINASGNVACPTVTVDGGSPVLMKGRGIPTTYKGFSGQVTVCEHALASPVTSVSIDNGGTMVSLPAPTGGSDHIVVVGDTGCRLKGHDDQWCKGGSLRRGQWGFPKISSSAAAGSDPDLILHVGDYLYRESTKADGTTCDPYDAARGWVHCGDNWPAWQDDFFTPAESGGLLTDGPWLFVRGNHESCGRGWQGYFLFFYPGRPPASCVDVVDPYSVTLTGLDIYVADTSNESSSSALTSFTTIFNDLAHATTASWLATHVPTRDLTPAYANSILGQRSQLKWLHVGHVHHFEHYAATSTRQAETVTGGSGTQLDGCSSSVPTCSPSSQGDCCYGKVSHSHQDEYTYLTVDYDVRNTLWNATLRDLGGNAVHTFSVK